MRPEKVETSRSRGGLKARCEEASATDRDASTESPQLALFPVPRVGVDRATRPRFGGVTFNAALDGRRCGRQLLGVSRAFSSGGWWTLAELAAVAGGSEAGCSARIRDLRKPEFGGYEVERRRRGDPRAGLWEYRLGGSRAAVRLTTDEGA